MADISCQRVTPSYNIYHFVWLLLLPFGISSAPELFQRRISHIFSALEGVICHIDDFLIFGANKSEHDQRLHAALTCLQGAGVTLNGDKCLFGQTQIKFLGHVIDHDGIHFDPDKVEAIVKVSPPTNIVQLRRFMRIANHIGKILTQTLGNVATTTRTTQLKKSLAVMTRAEAYFCISQGELT